MNKEWQERFDKEFGHLGELWNGKKASKDELTVKAFIQNLLDEGRKKWEEEHVCSKRFEF